MPEEEKSSPPPELSDDDDTLAEITLVYSDSEEDEDVSEQLHALNAKFSVFTQQVLERLDSILELKQIVSQLCEGKKATREANAAKKRAERAHQRSLKEVGLVPIPGQIFKNDPRIKVKYLLWAHVGIQFGLAGEWRKFLQYVSHDWNCNTYTKKPIARISNKCHYWDHGVRHETSWCDMFGSERALNPKTCYEIIWWGFRYHMVQIVTRMLRMPMFVETKSEFVKAMQVSCGDMAAMFAELGQLRQGNYEFDQGDAECLEKVPEFKYLALHVLQAFRRGISKGVDEDLELIRQGKVAFMCHCRQLQKEANNMVFQYKLRKGNVEESLRTRMMDLKDLGFFEFPELIKDV